MQTSVQEYLQKLLTKPTDYQLTNDEKKLLEKEGIEAFIYAKLTSKKFRKYKMTDISVTHTKGAIKTSVSKNEPINVVYPQGGYKLWRFPTSPRADWAEFFAISYVLSYIAPIAQAYKSGVNLIFYHHTLLMEIHDNLTTEEIKEYSDSFEIFVETFRKHLPANITISIRRDTDYYTRDEYRAELEEHRNIIEKEYPTWPEEKKEDFARMARLNIKWNGQENWDKLSDDEKEKKVYLAAIYEQAVSKLRRIHQHIKSPENIMVFTKAAGIFIGIGSTKASIAKYWVGTGVLVKKEDSYKTLIVSPSQFEKAKREQHTEVKVQLIEETNFNSIIVLENQLNFS